MIAGDMAKKLAGGMFAVSLKEIVLFYKSVNPANILNVSLRDLNNG